MMDQRTTPPRSFVATRILVSASLTNVTKVSLRRLIEELNWRGDAILRDKIKTIFLIPNDSPNRSLIWTRILGAVWSVPGRRSGKRTVRLIDNTDIQVEIRGCSMNCS